MTRTLTFECQSTLTLLGAGVGSQDDSQILESNQSYGHMYGITTNIVTSIQEICRLGEILSQVKDGDLTLILDDVLIDCQTLGDELRSWSLDAEPSKPILNGSELMLSIFRHQATAWYHGALIYYYHRIQGYRGSELVRDVDQVLAHMDAAEDTKDSAKPGTLGRLAPITWPMFIASCEAVGPRRVSCERWWLRIEHYKIANTRKQWVTIQQIWQGLDTAHTAGCSSSDWIEVYKGLDVSILPM